MELVAECTKVKTIKRHPRYTPVCAAYEAFLLTEFQI